MTDSIKLPVEIEYHFRWENPCFRQKIEVFACDEHVATVDKIGTLHLNSHVPCRTEVSRAARVWAGWEKATTDDRAPSTDNRPPTTESRFNPANTRITREQANAIRQLIRASYFNLPGLHSHVLLEVFDNLILEGNCVFDEINSKENTLKCRTRGCTSPLCSHKTDLSSNSSRSPKADVLSSDSGQSPKPEAPLDDRCTNCKEFDLDGCASCGPLTHAKVYGVDDSESEVRSQKPNDAVPDMRITMHHCPECRAVGEPDDHRHKPWCSKAGVVT